MPHNLLSIERSALRAWPALETRDIGGWLWRYSAGASQRANSIAALASPDMEIEAAIDLAEQYYGERDAPARFQVTDVANPTDLDDRLARRGYRINDPCTTLVIDLDGTHPMPVEAKLESRANAAWIETYSSAITVSRRAIAPRILALVPPESAFISLHLDGRVAATTLVVLDAANSIVECVATHPSARRRGAAHRAMLAAMHWAHANGARLMALGAVETNHPAQALYADLGFRLAGRYHTRIKDRHGAVT